jgi:K+-transporting ATPase KdpF subunit
MAATGSERVPMILDYVLGGAVTLGITIYLLYVLIRPEKF